MVESTVESSSEVVVGLTEKVLIRVLHVDDEASFVKVAKKCLEMQGPFQAETASSLEEAMEKMKKKTFDVIVSDYVMPGKDGLEFLKELRDKGNDIPFIIFTGKGREEVAIKALNLGADRYLNKGGDPETVYGELAHSIFQTVSRKRAEKMLRESEEKYRNLFENAKDVIVLFDLKGNITSINKAAIEYGFKKDEVIGKNMRKFLPKKYWSKLLKELVQIARGKTVESRIEIITPRGKKDAEYRSDPMIVDNRVVGVQGVLRDITERKKAENILTKSGEKYRTLIDDIPITVFNVNLNGKITYVNKRFEQETGYSREEIVGKNAFKLNLVSDETSKFLAKRMKALLMGKPTRCVEVQLRCKDGGWIWADLESRIIKKLGVPVGFQITGRNITERKRFEERLSALNIYSRSLNMAGSMEEIYRLTLDAMEKTLGFQIAFFMVVDKDMLCVVDQRGYPGDLSVKLPLDGSKRGVSVKVARTGKPMNVPDAEKEDDWVEFWPGIHSGLDVPVKIGRKVLGVIGVDSKSLNAFDEKDQKLLEILASHAATAMSNLEHAKKLKANVQEIRESQKKFERLFTNNPEATVYLSPDSHIVDINSRFSEVFGYSLDEIKGKHINDVIVPEDKMEEAEMLDKKAGERTVHFDTVRKGKDGSLVPVSISAAPMIVEGKLIGAIGSYKDVSELKKAEKALKSTLENLEMTNEKLRVVGKLTRHDVRNKLSAVIGNIFLTKQKVSADREASQYLDDAESAVRQVEKIFDFARTYEKLGVEELANINVEKSFKEAVSLFSDLHGIKVINDCRGSTVLADSLLRQLFYNLIDNSLKYGEKVSQVRIHYKEEEEDQLKLVYEDDGVGIPKAEKEKIFEEGYGKGTGYGLYLIRKICEVYGWTITETGKHGKGVQFAITIPKVDNEGKTLYKLH